MATTITNLALVERAQNAINSYSGFADSTKPFLKSFDKDVFYGNTVSLPVFSTGAVNTTSLDFATDDSNSIVYKPIAVNKIAKTQFIIPAYQAKQLENNFNTMIDGLIQKVGKQITDTAYGVYSSANFPVASNKVVVAAWNEASPTLAALYSVVEKAKSSGRLDPFGCKVLMPAATYAGIKSVLDSLPRDASLGFEVVPVYNTGFTQTAITDGSAVGLGIGADMGVGAEQFEFISNADNTLGFGVHIIEDAKYNNITIAVRSFYGHDLLNTTGFLWASAS